MTSTEEEKSEAYHHEKRRLQAQIAKSTAELEALEKVGDIPEIGYAMAWQHSFSEDNHYVELQPTKEVDARELAIKVLERMRAVMKTPPLKVNKEFNDRTGKITYSISGPLPGWTVKVEGGEARCKLKRVEENVYVPAKTIPARTEVVVRYEIENPEECLGPAGTHKEGE